MRRSSTIFALLFLLVLSAFGATLPALAAPPDPRAPGLSGTERLAALVERVKLEQQSSKTLEARFVQRQESSLLVAPEESRGTFSYAAPDRVRWEYLSPNPISVVIQGSEMTTWYQRLEPGREAEGRPLLEPGLQVPRRQRLHAEPARVLQRQAVDARRTLPSPTGWS